MKVASLKRKVGCSQLDNCTLNKYNNTSHWSVAGEEGASCVERTSAAVADLGTGH